MLIKNPIERIDDQGNVEKLIEARAFVPRDCVIVAVIGQRVDGSRIDCVVHSVMHVFEKEA